MNILVIDVGTSSIRGVLYDVCGKRRFVRQINYQVHFFDEICAEQDPSDWLESVVEISSCAEDYCRQNGMTVDAVSLTSQRSSIIPVDKAGTALRPAIMWQDKRNAGIVAELQSEAGFVHSLTGAGINTVFSGTKMTWLRRNESEIYEKTYKICTVVDFIIHEMTGVYRTDHTYGSRSLLMNICTRQWDDQLLGLFEVEREKLCELVAPGSVIGTISVDFARRTGLKSGIPVISGGGDQQCAALGQGVVRQGTVEITTGTGAFLLGCCEEVPERLDNNIICGAHAIPGKYVLESSMLACAALYNWAKRELFGDSGTTGGAFDRINQAVKASPVGANGCVAMPFFQGRGTPDWNSKARGAFFNMSLGTTRGDMARAVLEGITYEVQNNIDVMEGYVGAFDTIYIGGGLTKFSEFNQIQSDVYQKTLLREVNSAEQTVLGAWLGAAVTLGIQESYTTFFDADYFGREYQVFSPNPANKAVYEQRRKEMNLSYQALYAN